MKTITVLSLLFLSFISIQIKAQDFETICKIQSTSWNAASGACDFIITDSTIIIGDTLYNGNTYFTLYNFGYSENDSLGFLREDTVSGKLWYRHSLNNPPEFLIMDLSLQKNDIFTLCGFNDSIDIIVDTTYYDNEGRKHVDFGFGILDICGSVSQFEFIEGIGPTPGLFYQGDFYEPYCNSALLCCTKDGQQIFSNLIFNNVCMINETGIRETPLNNNSTIYPNPTSHSFQVKFRNDNEDLYTLEIYSSTGQRVYSFQTNSDSINIDDRLSGSGLYFYKLSSEKGEKYSGKIVFE